MPTHEHQRNPSAARPSVLLVVSLLNSGIICVEDVDEEFVGQTGTELSPTSPIESLQSFMQGVLKEVC